MLNYVAIHLKKDKVVIRLNEEIDYEILKQKLMEKLPEFKNFLKEEKLPIQVTGRILKIEQLKEIKSLIEHEMHAAVSFDIGEELGLHTIKKSYEKSTEISETKYYRGSIRSGQKVNFEGSIVILGDVNDGAEVIAEDNIVVVGVLRGLAHAGAKGNRRAIVCANKIDTVQIRIADVVKEIEKEDKAVILKCAYIQGQEILYK